MRCEQRMKPFTVFTVKVNKPKRGQVDPGVGPFLFLLPRVTEQGSSP